MILVLKEMSKGKLFYLLRYDDYEQEDLMRYTAGRDFLDENMDLQYDQNFTNYPDSKYIINFSF